MKTISGGVCAPKGFKAGGIWCGIKASCHPQDGLKKRDLALIYSEKICTAAARFTTNRVQAACVHVSQKHLMGRRLHAIIANSGNANACTGEAGFAAAYPASPVHALAFPELAMIAWSSLPIICFWLTSTLAACTLFVVNMAVAAQHFSE